MTDEPTRTGEPQLSALDSLVAELMADRDRHRDLSAHRLDLLNKAHNRYDTLRYGLRCQPLLTKVEMQVYLDKGTLPDDFAERLPYRIETYECDNCDGQLDMNVVMRAWFEDEPSWCPECCGPDFNPSLNASTERDA